MCSGDLRSSTDVAIMKNSSGGDILSPFCMKHDTKNLLTYSYVGISQSDNFAFTIAKKTTTTSIQVNQNIATLYKCIIDKHLSNCSSQIIRTITKEM